MEITKLTLSFFSVHIGIEDAKSVGKPHMVHKSEKFTRTTANKMISYSQPPGDAT